MSGESNIKVIEKELALARASEINLEKSKIRFHEEFYRETVRRKLTVKKVEGLRRDIQDTEKALQWVKKRILELEKLHLAAQPRAAHPIEDEKTEADLEREGYRKDCFGHWIDVRGLSLEKAREGQIWGKLINGEQWIFDPRAAQEFINNNEGGNHETGNA